MVIHSHPYLQKTVYGVTIAVETVMRWTPRQHLDWPSEEREEPTALLYISILLVSESRMLKGGTFDKLSTSCIKLVTCSSSEESSIAMLFGYGVVASNLDDRCQGHYQRLMQFYGLVETVRTACGRSSYLFSEKERARHHICDLMFGSDDGFVY